MKLNLIASDFIVISPEILGGTPVFKNSRVPVKTLFDFLKAGDSLNEFLENFPSVDKKDAIGVLSLVQSLINPDNEAAA